MKRIGLRQIASAMKQLDETTLLSRLSVKEISQLMKLYHRVIRTHLLNGYRVNIHGYGTHRIRFRRPRPYKTPQAGQGMTSPHFVADFTYSRRLLTKLTVLIEGDYVTWLKGRNDNFANRKEYLERINQQNQLTLLE